MQRWLLLCLFAALVSASAACNGGSSGGGGSTPPTATPLSTPPPVATASIFSPVTFDIFVSYLCSPTSAPAPAGKKPQSVMPITAATGTPLPPGSSPTPTPVPLPTIAAPTPAAVGSPQIRATLAPNTTAVGIALPSINGFSANLTIPGPANAPGVVYVAPAPAAAGAYAFTMVYSAQTVLCGYSGATLAAPYPVIAVKVPSSATTQVAITASQEVAFTLGPGNFTTPGVVNYNGGAVLQASTFTVPVINGLATFSIPNVSYAFQTDFTTYRYVFTPR